MDGSSISSRFTPKKLALDLEWYKLRDMLLGQNSVTQDVKKAIELAADCRHPDAVHLTELLAGKALTASNEASAFFLEKTLDDDAMALCFAEMMTGCRKVKRLRRSAELGFAYAAAQMATYTNTKAERFSFASQAANNGERDGFCALGKHYEHIKGGDLGKAKENFLIAAELGSVYSMLGFAHLLDSSNPLRWYWLGRAAMSGSCVDFIISFQFQVDKFLEPRSSQGAVVFAIGRALNGNVDIVNNEIFGIWGHHSSRIGPAVRAISFFNAQMVACRRAVDMWTFVGIRCKVSKDIRVKVGRLIWDDRHNALYAT